MSFGKMEGDVSAKNIAYKLQDDETEGPYHRQAREAMFQAGPFPELAALRDSAELKAYVRRAVVRDRHLKHLGLEGLLDDPGELARRIQAAQRWREELNEIGKEYLMDSVPAMRDSLTSHTDMERELEDLRKQASRLKHLEGQLAGGSAKCSKLRPRPSSPVV